MKPIIAGTLIALTVALATPASALNIHVGPRGVGIGLGHRHFGYRHGYRYHRGYVGRRFFHHGYRRF